MQFTIPAVLMRRGAPHQLQPWTLSFRARAKRFCFKFKYSKMLPISKNFRLSIRFQLRPFTFEFESKPEPAFSLRTKLNFIHKFKGFRRNRSGNNGILKTSKDYWFRRRRGNPYCYLLWVLFFAVIGCFVIMRLHSYIRSRFLWNFFWMASNHAGFFHQFFNAIFDGVSRSLGF